MDDESIKKIIEAIEGNSKAINLLHIALCGLIESICDNDSDDKAPISYLNGDSLD